MTIICKNCNVPKLENEFSPSSLSRYWNWCKKCANARSKRYREEQEEKLGMTWYQSRKQSDPNWATDNYLKHKESIKKWHDNNKERVRSIQKKNIRKIETRFAHAKRASSKRGITWSLGLDEYRILVNSPCYYCKGYFGKVEVGSGLDRMDNTKGYEPNNIVSCCSTCNKIKNDTLTVDETKIVVALIVSTRRDHQDNL